MCLCIYAGRRVCTKVCIHAGRELCMYFCLSVCLYVYKEGGIPWGGRWPVDWIIYIYIYTHVHVFVKRSLEVYISVVRSFASQQTGWSQQ